MKIERDTLVPASPDRVFALVDDLAVYPAWMDLVHDVDEETSNGDPRTWNVELQAQVGPFARSKRLRMARVVHEPFRRVVFERNEIDGRRHSSWVLTATLHPEEMGSTRLTMRLTYGGALWTGAVLQRVLDDHIERGATALCALVARSGDAGIDH